MADGLFYTVDLLASLFMVCIGLGVAWVIYLYIIDKNNIPMLFDITIQ